MILEVEQIFSSAHLYAQAQWDDKKNRETFGACYTPYGHGHNYRARASFAVSAEELEASLEACQSLLKKVCAPLDHQHLNFVIPEFKTKNPTTENIALYLMEKIQAQKPKNPLKSLKLYEMDDLWVEIHV